MPTPLEGLLPPEMQLTIDHEREGFVRCGTLGHAWHDYDSTWTPEFGNPLTLRCERCGTERRDSINDWGKLLNRHYFYPPFYKYPKGTKRPSRDEFRVMLLVQRFTEAKKARSNGRRRAAS